jgi:poly(A) polymerase
MPTQSTPLFDPSDSLFATASGIVRRLRDAGHTTLLAGGCVRDALLGRPLKDIDIATRATPDEVERLFPGETIAVGKSFGVVIVTRQSMAFEVATFRADGAYTDGRRPDSVQFTDAAEDAKRRDFTINGLFFDPLSGEVLDFVGGRVDLAAGIVRAIGDPASRFREDRLRLLRAVRFTAVLGFSLDPRTAEAARQSAPLLDSVSAERIGAEFTRMLCEAPRPSRMLDLLLDLRLLPVFLPEVAALQGIRQPPAYHPEGDVWTHTCLMLDAVAPPRDPLLAYAVLLHDVGKPPTCAYPDDGTPAANLPRFPNHARAGAELARAILIRLRRPTEWVEAVAAAVERHMTFSEVRNMRPARLRRFMGARTFPMELELHRLDVASSHRKTDILSFLEAKRSEYESEPVLPEPWVRGRDLLALGIAEGPELGRWLRRAYDAQLDARFADREALLDWVRAERSDTTADGDPP